MSIIAQVVALFPVKSDINPARIPPAMPPISNRVDKNAAFSDVTLIPKKDRK